MPMMRAEQLILDAYRLADRDIPDSDLDDEQPISLNVRMTLGDVRRIRSNVAMRERGRVGVEADLAARANQE